MILKQNKEYILHNNDNYFGDDIIKKNTGKVYVKKYYSNKSEPNLKTIFNVSKELDGSEFRIIKDDEYYRVENGTLRVRIFDNSIPKVPIFTSIKLSIKFIKEIESGKIQYF